MMPVAPRQMRPELAVAVAALSAVVISTTEVSTPTVVVLAIVAIGVIWSWGETTRLAWCWGALLPVDVITGVSPHLLDAVRYVGVLWLVLRAEPRLNTRPIRSITTLALSLALLAVVRGAFALGHGDRPGTTFAIVLLASVTAAWLVGQRPTMHLPILTGFMAGTAASAVVSLTQGLDLPTVSPSNQQGARFPGMTVTTALLTWHLAFALIIAVYLLLRRNSSSPTRVAATGVLLICGASFLVCGAQGGILGLGAAGVVTGLRSWRSISQRALLRAAVATALLAVVLFTAIVALNLPTPTLGGLHGRDSQVNERARLDVDRNGLNELAAHPLLGVNASEFVARNNRNEAHFLPIASGVVAGMLGFAVASFVVVYVIVQLVKSPARNSPATWMGCALLTAMVADSFTEPSGPFAGLARTVPLFIAIVAWQGRWPPLEAPQGSNNDRTSGSTLGDTAMTSLP